MTIVGRTSGRVAGSRLVVGALSVVLVLAVGGCTRAAAPGGAAVSESAAAAPVWPDPASTVLVPASGEGAPAVEAVLADHASSDAFGTFDHQVEERFPDTYSASAFRSEEGGPAWVAFTGTVPRAAAALAAGLPLDVELRGGAALSEAEREAAMQAMLDTFTAGMDGVGGWTAGLDAPTGVLTIDYVPGDAAAPTAALTSAMVAAGQEAIGRDAGVSVEYAPDETDAKTTEPAVWFLPAGFVADPAATSVEVLVEEQGCTSGEGAEGNTAEPVVEVTTTEVRIAVSTYIRLGPQFCPGHPLAPVVVDLDEPLGDRTLVDVNGAVDDDHAPPESMHSDIVVPPSGSLAG